MENINIALSDAERNKELFEYEMTEVILQLKGEFAKISGKDLHLDETQFIAQEINVQTEVPDVIVTPIKVEGVAVTGNAFGNTFVLPEWHVLNSEIDCPTVPVSVSAVLNSIHLAPLELDCPAVQPINEIAIGEVKFAMPSVLEITQKISLTNLPEIVVSPADIKSIDHTIKIPDSVPKVKQNSIEVEIPTVTMKFPSIADVKTKHFVLDTSAINKIQISSIDSAYSVSVEKIEIPDTNISISEQKNISVEQITLEIPEIKSLSCSQPIESVTLPKADIQVSQPLKPQFDFDISESVPIENSKSEKIHIPVMSNNFMRKLQIDIVQQSINFESPAINLQPLPSVIISKPKSIMIPGKVDVSGNIQAILESVV